jgi:hypothetical protein
VTAKSSRKKTTPSRPREETVAERPERDAQGHFATHPDDPATEYYDARNDEGEFAVEAPDQPTPTPTAPVEPVAPKGYCDNHPDRAAVFVTNFPWVQTQRFCAQCVPAQYKPLMQ